MYFVYVLLSQSSKRTYIGYTSNLQRRFLEHNETETKGFTLRYRPWTLIYHESFASRKDAMAREKFFKTGRGREIISQIISDFLSDDAVSAAAEKD